MKDLLKTTPNSPMKKAEKLLELQSIMRDIKPQIDELKSELLEITQKMDVYSLKTGKYTISRAKRVTPQVVDFKQLKKSLDEAEIPYLTQEVFSEQMDLVFKQAIEKKMDLPGLEAKETEYITIRLPKGGEK